MSFFTLFVIVYNFCHCVQSLSLFTIFAIVYNLCYCLQSLSLFTIFVLFTIFGIAYNLCNFLQLLSLLTIFVSVYNLDHYLQSLLLLTKTRFCPHTLKKCKETLLNSLPLSEGILRIVRGFVNVVCLDSLSPNWQEKEWNLKLRKLGKQWYLRIQVILFIELESLFCVSNKPPNCYNKQPKICKVFSFMICIENMESGKILSELKCKEKIMAW